MKKIRLCLLSIATLLGSVGGLFAAAPALVAAGVVATGAAGLSIYRSFVETDTAAAFEFFSSCWSCRIFGGVVSGLSNVSADIYANLGEFTALLALILTPLFLLWKILGGYITGKPETNAWKIGGTYGLHLAKLAFVSMLLLIPLPQIMGRAVVEPIMNAGLAIQNVMAEDSAPTNANFNACLIATTALNNPSHDKGTFSNGFTQKLRCSVAQFHMLTANGMTQGWLLFNSAFDSKNMIKIENTIPVFPNIAMLLTGLLLLIVYVWIILPVVMSILEFVMKLAIDVIFLPLMLLGWLMKGNQIFEVKDADLIGTINDAAKSALSLGLLAMFFGFALQLTSLATPNDTGTGQLLLLGLFLGIFISSMTTLIKNLVSGAEIPDKLYKDTMSNMTKLWENIKKFGKKQGAK